MEILDYQQKRRLFRAIICYLTHHVWSESRDWIKRYPRLIDQTPWICNKCNSTLKDC